ncbi:MAG: c-type cytochrome domain-containing protein, partial [Gemmataceae bacterium]
MLGLIVFAMAAAPMGIDFDTAVKPVLIRHCLSCHGPQTKRAGLRLDTASAALEGGASGPALVPGNSGKSLIIRAMVGEEGLERMPPRGDRVTAAELATIAAWIDAGAKPGMTEAVQGPSKPTLWSLTPPKAIAIPAGEASHPIDRFVRQRLAREKLLPSPEA